MIQFVGVYVNAKIVENKMINIARIAIESDYPRATLAKLIDTNQPLAFK